MLLNDVHESMIVSYIASAVFFLGFEGGSLPGVDCDAVLFAGTLVAFEAIRVANKYPDG